jgi:heparanase 1
MIAAVKAGIRPGQAMPELWMGEGNAAGHGGRLGVTNTFINSFWYLVSPFASIRNTALLALFALSLALPRADGRQQNAMGAAASLGIARFNRQTLVGGGYELVNRSTLEPNPDYFAAMLWRKLVGAAALRVEISPLAARGRDVRAYAFCARNGTDSTGEPCTGGAFVRIPPDWFLHGYSLMQYRGAHGHDSTTHG